MDSEPDMALVPVTRGAKLSVYLLEVRGTCEVRDFLQWLGMRQPGVHATVMGILGQIADAGFLTPQTYYRKIEGWEGQWEVRQGRHRLYGFVVANSLVLCCYHLKQGQKAPREVLGRVARLRREWTLNYETPR